MQAGLSALRSNISCFSQGQLRWSWWNGGMILVPLVMAVVAWYVLVVAKAWTKKRLRLPPGPLGIPVFGNLPFLDRNLHHHLTQLAQTYGPIMSLRLGRRLCVIVSSPSIAKELLREHDATVANHDVPTAAMVLPNGLHGLAWVPHGQQWRTLRRLAVGGMLSNAGLEPHRDLRRCQIRQMVRRVQGQADAGSPVQVRELIYSTLYEVVTGMLWGGVLEEAGMKEVAKEFRQVVEDIQGTFGRLNISDFFPILAPLDLQGLERRRKKLSERLHQILDSIINQRLRMENQSNHGKENADFLQLLLRTMEKAETSMPITIDHVKGLLLEGARGISLVISVGSIHCPGLSLDQINEILTSKLVDYLQDLVMAGMDTTTSTTEWAMSELMNNPQVMKKVQEELDQVIGTSSLVEETHLSKLPYLNAIVKETLRLRPAGPIMLPRTPSETCTAGGYTVPKECRIVVNLWGMQRDPDAWDNPSEFRPERFLNSEKRDFSGNDFHFFPFGTGRRICPGALMADRMMMFALATLLHMFNWRLPEGTQLDLLEKFGTVMKKAEPLVVVPSRRLPNPDLYSSIF
ncbi:geranylhydroquinone 3''-hydroxylase CYP76B74-like [Aristolochia californica]|uniref:geranylhydroquinone 3''-hydroxylase CYP76B74-like n=1 Tax=Aristolochia californica TaxID=171875 RepID=UPI0035DA6916